MNAFRKTRLVVLFGLVAVLALTLGVAPAEAGGHHNSHSHNSHAHNFQNFHKVHSIYPSSYNHGHYCPTTYQPIVKYVVKPYNYPVTLVDCYGQPYVVWQTSYQTVPTTFYQ